MSIEQHPIPQDVAGYKFRLIGDMTLKQFIWLAGGIILGLVVYSLPLPFFFKYPLAAIGVLLGAGIAFVPVEGRPMDKWLIAFIRSIYSPTQYVWSKPDEDQQSVTQHPIHSKAPVSSQPSIVTPPVTEPSSPVVAPPPVVAAPVEPKNLQPIQSVKTEPLLQVIPPSTKIEPALPVTTPPITPQSQVTAPSATPTAQLPIPFTPTSGNTLVGMTLTPDGKILDGCLIEITANGLSLRATKSNQLGQFLFAKPLENGIYQIITEKAGYQFDTYSLNLTGQIVKPLRLQAIGQS
jgi:hypothetical protein